MSDRTPDPDIMFYFVYSILKWDKTYLAMHFVVIALVAINAVHALSACKFDVLSTDATRFQCVLPKANTEECIAIALEAVTGKEYLSAVESSCDIEILTNVNGDDLKKVCTGRGGTIGVFKTKDSIPGECDPV